MSLSAKHTIAAMSIALSSHASGQPVGATVSAVQQGIHTHLPPLQHTHRPLNDQAQQNTQKQRERDQALKILQEIQRNNELLRLQGEKITKEREMQRLRAEKERLEWEARRNSGNNQPYGYVPNSLGSSFHNPNYLAQQPTWKPIGLLMGDAQGIQGAVITGLRDPIAKGNTFVIGDIIYNINNIPMANAYAVSQYLRNIPIHGRTSFFVKRGSNLLEISGQNNMFYR